MNALRQTAVVDIASSDPVLAVHDLEISGSWYQDVLGADLDDVDPGNWRLCRVGAVTFMLGRCPDVLPAREIGDHSYIAYLHVDDVDGFLPQGCRTRCRRVEATTG